MRPHVWDMTSAELLAEQARREENRRLGRSLSYIDETPTPEQIVANKKRADVLEATEQRDITKMARAIGLRVRDQSQKRPSKVAPGIPDLIVTCNAVGFFGYWETKRQVGGVRSTSQIEFGDDCIAARIPYGFGDRYEFARWLTAHGFTPPAIPR